MTTNATTLHDARVALGLAAPRVTGHTGTDSLNTGTDGARLRSGDTPATRRRSGRSATSRAPRVSDGTKRTVRVARLADVTPRDDAHATALIEAMLHAQARLLATRE